MYWSSGFLSIICSRNALLKRLVSTQALYTAIGGLYMAISEILLLEQRKHVQKMGATPPAMDAAPVWLSLRSSASGTESHVNCAPVGAALSRDFNDPAHTPKVAG